MEKKKSRSKAHLGTKKKMIREAAKERDGSRNKQQRPAARE